MSVKDKIGLAVRGRARWMLRPGESLPLGAPRSINEILKPDQRGPESLLLPRRRIRGLHGRHELVRRIMRTQTHRIGTKRLFKRPSSLDQFLGSLLQLLLARVGGL